MGLLVELNYLPLSPGAIAGERARSGHDGGGSGLAGTPVPV